MLALHKKAMANEDVLVSHYPIHYPPLRWHNNVIVLSHGVDWKEPTTLLLDRFKKHAALQARENGVKIVANDTCFIRALGVEAEPGIAYFKEIAPKIWFVPNCIDFDKFTTVDTERENIILVPRNIRKARGIHLAIEAFKLFHARNRSFRMVVAGGPLRGDYYRYCGELVAKYDLSNSVFFTGHMQNDELIELYRKAMITLVPTLDFEGTSISALESMACRTPVVSTRIGGLMDLPTFKVGLSPEEVAEGVESVLRTWKTESERQFERAAAVFNLNNWKKAWIRIIES